MSGMEHGSVPTCCPLSAFLVCWPMAASQGPHHSRWGLWVSIRVWAHLKLGACAQEMPRAAALAPDPVTASCTPRGKRKVFCAGRGKRKAFSAGGGKRKEFSAGGDWPGASRCVLALQACGRLISWTLLLLQSLLLFFNWVESGNLVSPFYTNKRDLLFRGPAL